jgi:hypothetical protein
LHEIILNSGWDTFWVAILFVAMLTMGIFRLDEVFANSNRDRRPIRRPAGMDKNGDPVLCDPDGRPWGKSRQGR